MALVASLSNMLASSLGGVRNDFGFYNAAVLDRQRLRVPAEKARQETSLSPGRLVRLDGQRETRGLYVISVLEETPETVNLRRQGFIRVTPVALLTGGAEDHTAKLQLV